MVMKSMLISLLVIGVVAMLGTDAYARFHCDGWLCKEFNIKDLEKIVYEAKQHEGSEVWMIGFTRQVGKTEEFDNISREMENVRQMLIQRELKPDMFRWLILEGYAPLDPERGVLKVIVAWPERQ
jgi:hypothetical protein